MNTDDVRSEVVDRKVAELGPRFATKDVSDDPDVKHQHGHLATEGNYHGTIGRYLSIHADRLGIRKDASSGRRGQWWVKSASTGPSAGERIAEIRERRDREVVRRGHRMAVEWMASAEFRTIVELFDAEPAIGGTYFRVGERGVQPVDLDARSPKPLIGVGGAIRCYTPPARVADELPGRVAELLAKRAGCSPSREKQLEAAMIRHALANGLRLPGLPERVRFFSSQWRVGLPAGAALPDLLGVDLDTGGLVVIELKADPGEWAAAQAQASAYTGHLARHAEEFADFFSTLASAMGGLYGAPELEGVRVDPARAIVEVVTSEVGGEGSF